jgi:hypothetical protein
MTQEYNCDRCRYRIEQKDLTEYRNDLKLCSECLEIMNNEEYNKCACCNEIDEDRNFDTDNGFAICESCYSDETSDPDIEITIHLDKGEELYKDIELIWIGTYTHQSSDSIYIDDFNKVDHYSNWRGYTDIVSNKWTEIGLVNVRAFDESQEHLAKGVNSFGDMLLDKGIIYASAQCKTSNCMVSNLSYWVKNEDLKKAMRIKKRLLKQYNMNEDDF